MAVVKNMMVRAGADFSAITKQAAKASQSMRGMQNSVSRSCNAMTKAANGLKKAFAAIGIGVSFAAIAAAARDAASAYDEQVQSEVKLAQVMRNTMDATNDEIQSILDLASAQQQLGIVGDEVQLAGAQELATYLETTDALKELIPVMNDMAAQQYGFNVTSEETTSIATMLGKVMEGQTSALSRYGYYFSEAEENILKFGTEAQRAATLAQVVERSVGGMNQALAATPTGRMKQLSNTLGDIKEQFGQAVRTIGTVFLPVLQTVAKVLAAIATLANKVAQTIANVFGGTAAGKEWQFIPTGTATAISDTADATDSLSDSTADLASNTNKAAKATKDAAKAAKEAQQAYQQASFDTLDILKKNKEEEEEEEDDYTYDSPYSPSSGSSGSNGGAGDMIRETATATESAAGESIGWLEKVLEKAKALVKDFLGALDFTNLKEAFARLKEAAQPLIEDIGEGLAWLYENVLKPLAAWTISELAPRLVDTLAASFKFLHGVIEALKPFLEAIWPILKWFAELAGFLITRALDELNHALSALGDWMAGNLSSFETFQVILQLLSAVALGGIIGDLFMLANAAGAAATAAAGLGAAVGAGGAAAGAGMAAAGAGGLLAALGTGATAVGGFSLAIEGTMVPALTAGAGAAGTAAAGAAGLLGPIAAVIAIVAALGVAIYEVVKHWDEIKEGAAKAIDGVKQAWANASEWWETKVAEPIKDMSKALWTSIKDEAKREAEIIKETWNAVKMALSTAFENIRQKASEAFDTVRQKVNAAWESVKQSWGTAKSFFNNNVFTPLTSAAKSAASTVINKFEQMITAAKNAANKIKEALSNISSAWSSVQSSVGSAINNAVSSVKSKVSSLTISLPHLAEGAVIPPNREFAAVLGDQGSGMNLETPERLLREIVREESGNDAILMMLSDILDAVRDGKEITIDGYKVGRTLRRYQMMDARAHG